MSATSSARRWPIEGLMAFFLEATFVGSVLLRLGQAFERSASRRRLARRARLELLSPLDPDRQWLDAEPGRRRLQSRHDAHGDDVVLRGPVQPVAQAKFVHTVSAGYVTASVFVLGVSAWYLLKGPPCGIGAPVDLGRRRVSASPRRSRSWCWATSRATRPATPSDEARGDRGDVGDAEAPARPLR
jgi:hypothetical protein